jgi:hypothetical protein
MRLLAVLAPAAMLLGQQAPEEAFFERIHAKLAASFATGAGEFLLLAHPGVPIGEPDPVSVAILADRVPLPASRYLPSTATVSGVLADILEQGETTSFQIMSSRNRALMAQRVLWDRRRPGRPTPAHAAYLKHRDAYLWAKDTLELARAERLASGRPVPGGLEAREEAALEAWETRGAKAQIEQALATLREINDENLKLVFFNMRKGLASQEADDPQAGPWFPVVADPPLETWLDEEDWLPFRFAHADRALPEGTGSLPPGTTTAGALPRDFLSTLSLTVDTKRVSLARPWLDEGIFTSHGWRFQLNSGSQAVSTGNPRDADPGRMPLLVTGLLLARNLRMEGTWSGSPTADLASAGPFSLRGPWTPDGAGLHTSFSFHRGALTLVTEGPQVLGFFCRIVPRSPDPDAKAFR